MDLKSVFQGESPLTLLPMASFISILPMQMYCKSCEVADFFYKL